MKVIKMSEQLADPMLAVVPNLVTCINNRINADKFENMELLETLKLFLSYAAACPQQPQPPTLVDAIFITAKEYNQPITREMAFELAKKIVGEFR
jgi:hypothetical protein